MEKFNTVPSSTPEPVAEEGMRVYGEGKNLELAKQTVLLEAQINSHDRAYMLRASDKWAEWYIEKE